MGHWYSKEAEPCYTVIGANGKERDTTLRDARKEGWVPSVTTIMNDMAKPGLLIYMQNQIAEAAYNQRKLKDYDKWKNIVISKSKEHSKQAAERGSQLHDSFEKYYKGQPIPKKDKPFVEPVVEFLRERFPDIDWVAEASFYCSLGYGGKVDLHYPGEWKWEDREEETYEDYFDDWGDLIDERLVVKKHRKKVYSKVPIVLDFKTKDKPDTSIMKPFDEHHMQSAAYAYGLHEQLNLRPLEESEWERYNMFISTQTPGNFKLTESTDFEREFGMFETLTKFWQFRNNYYPGDL